jgi:hypothetical protein
MVPLHDTDMALNLSWRKLWSASLDNDNDKVCDTTSSVGATCSLVGVEKLKDMVKLWLHTAQLVRKVGGESVRGIWALCGKRLPTQFWCDGFPVKIGESQTTNRNLGLAIGKFAQNWGHWTSVTKLAWLLGNSDFWSPFFVNMITRRISWLGNFVCLHVEANGKLGKGFTLLEVWNVKQAVEKR